jgi:hypothetical protein
MRSIYDCSPEARFSFAALAQHISTPLDRGTAAAKFSLDNISRIIDGQECAPAAETDNGEVTFFYGNL